MFRLLDRSGHGVVPVGRVLALSRASVFSDWTEEDVLELAAGRHEWDSVDFRGFVDMVTCGRGWTDKNK